MNSLLHLVGRCLGEKGPQTLATIHNRRHLSEDDERDDVQAFAVVETLYSSEGTATDVRTTMQHHLRSQSRTEFLAIKILLALQDAIKAGKAMGPAMKAAYEDAQQNVDDFVQKHPIFSACIVTVLAIAILVVLIPWVVEALGFASRGPVAGE